jgi:hypothetical protein
MNAIVLPSTEKERKIVEQALPGFMFELLFDSLIKDGYDIRLDLKELAGKCSAAAFVDQGLDVFTIRRLADRVQKDGYDILKTANVEEVQYIVGGLARCLVRMVYDGVGVNRDATIIALGICAEMDDGVDDWGKKLTVDVLAGKLETAFTEKGYMFKTVTLDPQPG